MRTVAAALLSLFAVLVNADEAFDKWKQAFVAEGVVPDVIPTSNFSAILEVTYTVSGAPLSITPAKNVTRTQTANIPSFALRAVPDVPFTPSGSYVLFFLDPDVPSRENRSLSEIIHMAAPGYTVGTAGANGALTLSNTTSAILPYMGPGRPNGYPPGRYTFVLFKSSPEFEKQTALTSSTARTQFDVSAFAEKFNLGAPVAGNFMYCAGNPA